MPVVLRPCAQPRCPEYAQPGDPYCQHHRQPRHHHTNRWKRLRNRTVKTQPRICGICHQPILPGQPVNVDHITPLAQGGAPYDHRNLRVTHASCNVERKQGCEE